MSGIVRDGSRWCSRRSTPSTRTAPTRAARSTSTARSRRRGCCRRRGRPCARRSRCGRRRARARGVQPLDELPLRGGLRRRPPRGGPRRARPRARADGGPRRPRPVGDPAAEHPQGARRDDGDRHTARRGVGEGADGGPKDEPEDVATGTWAGVVPLRCGPERSSPTGTARSRRTYAAGWRTGERWARVPPMERTLVLVKPDGVRRGLTGEVIRRIEAKGYRLVRLELRDGDPRAPRRALRRARGQAVLRAAGRVHALRAGRRDDRRGGARRRRLPRPGRRHRPDGGRSRARSAATSAATGGSRSSRTSSTAPTPSSPPSARSRSGSRSRSRAGLATSYRERGPPARSRPGTCRGTVPATAGPGDRPPA